MKIYKTTKELQAALNSLRQKGQTIAFIPTMGALHQGHLSLVERGMQECDHCVTSIFVNPTQFNQAADLDKYPRDLQGDVDLLSTLGDSIVYAPTVEDVYPTDIDTSVDLDLGSLATAMEGEFRPGHFDGVVQVVNRLLNIVKPEALIMGQKDFQQFAIIKYMIQQLNIPTQLIMGETMRTETGLAMSSRNRRLSDRGRETAADIYRMLCYARDMYGITPLPLLLQEAKVSLHPDFEIEYLTIADADTLIPLDQASTKPAVICTAAFLEGIRLIDNLPLDPIPH